MADLAYDYRWKMLVLGDSQGGKSNLVSQFAEGVFDATSQPTMGIKPTYKFTQCNSKTIKAAIWDIAGLEKYRSNGITRYHESVGALVVYDVTSRQSFENAARWLGEVRDHAEPDTVTMLVGNKTDLKNWRVVKTEEGRKFARENKTLFVETSALDKSQVDLAFQKLLNGIYKQQCTDQKQ
ncbi:Gtp-bound Rab11 in complex with Fip3 [Fusarium avenaceum]|nr:Gtp-bound Rab11 in complex with Fip3 [Fusarium avenaceum]